eukprot:183277-Rhodomonas_salina.2
MVLKAFRSFSRQILADSLKGYAKSQSMLRDVGRTCQGISIRDFCGYSWCWFGVSRDALASEPVVEAWAGFAHWQSTTKL